MKLCVFIALSLTIFFVALQGPVGEIRTNQEHFSFKNEKKIKNQPQTKFTGSYKKKSVNQNKIITQEWQVNLVTFKEILRHIGPC